MAKLSTVSASRASDRELFTVTLELPLWFWPVWPSGSTMAAVATAVETFGKDVRSAREGRAWIQEDLAYRSGLSVVQISRVERGKREIRLTTLVRLVSALDVSADFLLRGVKMAR